MMSLLEFSVLGRTLLFALFLTSGGSGEVLAALQGTEQHEPKIVIFHNTTDVKFSPSGRLVIFQLPASFLVVKSDKIPTSTEQLQAMPTTEGYAIGFLPSELVAYKQNRTIRILDPVKDETKLAISERDIDESGLDAFEARPLAIRSNEELFTGDGSWHWGGSMGNIYSFDLRQQKVTKKTKIPGMFYPQISSSGRYLVFEYGAEANNNAYIYNIRKNTNHSIHKYFGFKKEFPKFDEFSEAPIIWLRGQERFLLFVSEGGDSDNEDSEFLVLVDVPSKRVVWKSQLSQWFFPTYFQQIDEEFAVFSNESGVFYVELTSGIIAGPRFKGESASVSPDGKRVAYYQSETLMISDNAGKNNKSIMALPGQSEIAKSYKAMGMHSPIWTPDSKSLFVLTNTGASWVRF